MTSLHEIFNKGLYALYNNNIKEAEDAFNYCLKITPDDTESKLALSDILLKKGNFIQCLRILLSLHTPLSPIAPHLSEAIDHCSQSDLENFRHQFEKLLDVQKYEFIGLKGLARLSQTAERHPDPMLADQLTHHRLPNGEQWWLPPITNPLDIVCATMAAGRPFEPELIAVAQQIVSPGALVLDGGANFGQVSLAFARMVGPGGRVLAIEADPFVAAALASNMRLNGADWVDVLQTALWDSDGETVYFPPYNLAETPSLGSRSLDPQAQCGDTPIPTATIDSIMRTQGQNKPLALLKLDLQGAELRALRGAQETLGRDRPAVILEIDPDCMPAFEYNSMDLSQFLINQGYTQAQPIDEMNWLVRHG